MKRGRLDYASLFFLVFACLLGGYMRLSQVVASDYPLNDGGMFYQMTVDLQDNHYRLPAETTYNQLDIPFVYPPLPFYFIGMLSDFSGIRLMDLFRVVPAIISTLTIPAFYFLAKEILDSEAQSSFSVLVFAMIPASFKWLIMGGGIPRSIGFLFALLTLLHLYRLYSAQKAKYIYTSAVFAAITVLSHPETALHTLASILVFFLYYGRNRTGIKHSILVAGLTFIFTSPWIITILGQHRVDPILSAGQTGFHNLDALFNLLLFNITDENILAITSVLAIIGLFIQLARGDTFLPIWFLVVYASEPRSAPLYESPIVAMSAAITLDVAIFPLLNKLEASRKPSLKINSTSWAEKLFAGRATKSIFLVILIPWIFNAFSVPLLIRRNISLTQQDSEAFLWIRANTPPDSRFLTISGYQPFTDPVSEWFPTLTQRVNVNTPQGYEWIEGQNFDQILLAAEDVTKCANKKIDCLANWKTKTGLDFEYIYIRKNFDDQEGLLLSSPLEKELAESSDFESIYASKVITIFQER